MPLTFRKRRVHKQIVEYAHAFPLIPKFFLHFAGGTDALFFFVGVVWYFEWESGFVSIFPWICTLRVRLSTGRFFFVHLGKFNEMARQLWTGAERELATERNQISPRARRWVNVTRFCLCRHTALLILP